MISTIVNAQQYDNIAANNSVNSKKEKKQVLDAYELLNAGAQNAYYVAHNLLKTVKTDYAKANTNLLLAYYFKNRGLIDSSIFYTNKHLTFNILDSDSLITRRNILAFNLLAINYKNKGLIEESKKWHQKGITATSKFKEIDLYYMHLHGLALTYSLMEDYNQALKLFKECLSYTGNPEIIMGSYINMGEIYVKLKDFDASNACFEKGLKLAIDHKRPHALAAIKFNLASNAQDQGKLNAAIGIYKEIMDIADKNEFHKDKLMAQMNIGNVLIDSEKYEDAKIIYSGALYSAIELGYLDQQLNIYENLQLIALQNNNYKDAFHFGDKYNNIKDSITIRQKSKEINELEVRYQTLQKEKEIKVLQIENTNRKLELTNQREAIRNLTLKQEIEKKEKEIRKKENENMVLSFQNATEKTINENILLKKNQEIKDARFKIQQAETTRQKGFKNIILYSFLIFLIPIISLLFIYYQKLQAQSELNAKQEEISEQKIAALLRNQELKLIKASIKGQDNERKRIAQELHDSIGGNLAAIKLQLNNSVVSGNQSQIKSINNQIDNTYNQVRDLSHNLIPKKFSESNFCDVLEEYFNNVSGVISLSSTFITYPRRAIDLLEEHIQIEIFKIIQELITNTIKHAKATVIELQLNLVDDVLWILFEDNGIGFNVNEKKDGIGYGNIKNRLNKISGSLDIDSRIRRGTIINIEIPNLTITTNEI